MDFLCDTGFCLRLHQVIFPLFSLGQLLYAASMGAHVLGMFGMSLMVH